MTDQTFQTEVEFLKVEESLGLIMGWAIICKENGEPYFDLQGDHIPEEAMLKAAANFMQNSRIAAEMHARNPDKSVTKSGVTVFAWPMTTEIAKAMGIDSPRTGLLVAVKPDNAEALEKARSGQYTGFSIGGSRIRDEDEDGVEKAYNFVAPGGAKLEN